MDVREYFNKGDMQLPTKKGVTLTVDMWKKLKYLTEDVDKVIEQMGGNISSN